MIKIMFADRICLIHTHVRFQFLLEASMKPTAFWDAAPVSNVC
jgi:hypothetical protein